MLSEFENVDKVNSCKSMKFLGRRFLCYFFLCYSCEGKRRCMYNIKTWFLGPCGKSKMVSKLFWLCYPFASAWSLL